MWENILAFAKTHGWEGHQKTSRASTLYWRFRRIKYVTEKVVARVSDHKPHCIISIDIRFGNEFYTGILHLLQRLARDPKPA